MGWMRIGPGRVVEVVRARVDRGGWWGMDGVDRGG